MKRIRHILASFIAAAAVITAGIQVKAAYNYKVTLLSGLYGTIDGSEKVEFEIPYNKTVTFATAGENVVVTAGDKTYTVKVNTDDSAARFYCKGFHISGIETVVNGTQTIKEDTVFVASYGMKSKAVAYTAKFVDASGGILAASKTFYGNIGDKPVVSCEYIEGYVPNANQMTGTLVDPNNLPPDWPAERVPNEFTFVYHPGEAIPGGGGGGVTGEGGYTFTDNGTEVVYLPGGGGNAGGNAGANAGGNAGGNVAPAADNNAQAADNAADAGNNEPAEIIDLDDTDVPLANVTSPEPNDQQGVVNNKPGLNFVWIMAMILSGFGIIALIAILIMLMKRKKKEQMQG